MTLLPAYDLRRQRDRLLDLLAIGETYPLQDTPLPTQTILVGFGELAHIPVYFSQLDVRYTLYFEENPVTRQDGGSVVVSGNGETVFLETEAIAEDVTYTIWATKIDSGRQSRLHQQVQIRVGLDTRLHAFIRDLPPLADSLLMPPPALARFGQTVAVELEASQEGIDYDLVVLQPGTAGEPELAQVISRQTVRGNRQNISLQIDDVTMDIDIRLRATRSGAGADAPDQLSAILDVVLPLRVRASQQLVVSALPAVVDHEAPAQLRLAGAQADVSYQLFARPLLDADYAYGQAAGAGVIQVPVPEAEPLPIYFPSAGPAWQLPADFVSLGPAQTGQESLDFDIPPLTRDTLVLVQARKAHALTLLPQEPDATVPSFVQLASPAVFLVRPQPRPALSLQALADGHTFQIQGGEPGTFLHFLDENEAPAAAPLYFYERDELVQRYFKGVARFRVAVNLVVDAGHEEDASGEATVAQPQLTLPALTTPIQLLLEAVYARSQARVRLAEP
ncbi:MAG: hypothetical protein KDE04_21835, partial [Anaerolineales bacterium]|nr:hypothetical protein [Anaerolineales bacterium]